MTCSVMDHPQHYGLALLVPPPLAHAWLWQYGAWPEPFWKGRPHQQWMMDVGVRNTTKGRSLRRIWSEHSFAAAAT